MPNEKERETKSKGAPKDREGKEGKEAKEGKEGKEKREK